MPLLRASETSRILHTLYAYLDRSLVVVNSTSLELMQRPVQYRNFCRGRAHCRLSRVSSKVDRRGRDKSARSMHAVPDAGLDWIGELNWIDESIVYGPSDPHLRGHLRRARPGRVHAARLRKKSATRSQVQWSNGIYGDVPSWYIILTLIGDSSRRTAIFLSSSIATCLPLLATPTADHSPMVGSPAGMTSAYCCARSTTRADSALYFDSYRAWYVRERNAVSIA